MTADITTQTYSSKSTAHRGAIRAGLEPIDFKVVPCADKVGRWQIELREVVEQEVVDPTTEAVLTAEVEIETLKVVEAFEEDKIEGIGHTRYQRHKELIAGGYTHTHVEASWSDDGDAENGPHLSGGPAYDEYSLRDGDEMHLVYIGADGKEDYQKEPAWIHDGPTEEAPVERDDLGKAIAAIETPAQLDALSAALGILTKSRKFRALEAVEPKAEKKAKAPKAGDTIRNPGEESALVTKARDLFGLSNPRQKHFDAIAAAHRGELPKEPSFESPSYVPHKKAFDKIKELVDAGDGDKVEEAAKALNTGWTIRKRIQEYGLLAAIALKTQQAAQ